MMTRYNLEVNDEMFKKKLDALVNQFFKILPIKESGEPSLTDYMKSLQREMLGLESLIVALENDAQYLTLLSVLQYLIDHDCDVAIVKSDVFKAISILKRMQKRFVGKNGGDSGGRLGQI